MKIPRDLKPGDRLWYSKTEYATVENRADLDTPYYLDGAVRAITPRGLVMFYEAELGIEQFSDTPPIIRIERIASKPAKTTVDRDAAWLRRLADTIAGMAAVGADCRFKREARRLRAIARRLQGGKP